MVKKSMVFKSLKFYCLFYRGDKEKPQVKSKLQNEKSPSEISNTVDGVSQVMDTPQVISD